ncbi:MAG: ferritin [Porphyromonadaceae bacterium]|jgi:ferritin|nr:ferritin [Porphyromonadaceae bacterium]
MLNPKIAKMLNDQVNKELHSSYLYLDMANYYYDNNLNGFGNWFDVQTEEEKAHGMLIIQYLRNNGIKIDLKEIPAPDVKYKNFKEPLDAAFEHEKYITASINEIYAEAYLVKDFRTMQFLDWFVKEQGEEEQTSDDLCKRFEMFGNDPKGLYLLDSELASRTFEAPDLTL